MRRRVLVVDDSAFMRRLVRELVEASGEFDVVGTARDGEEAIRLVHALDPDIVTLDIEMPGLDGLDVLGYVMSEAPRPVVMLSAAGDDRDAASSAATLRALELGAVDFVRKPAGPISLDLTPVAGRLLEALRAAAATNLDGVCVLARLGRVPVVRPRHGTAGAAARHVVVIAASTGGPAALAQLVPALPASLEAAVLIVQHMPPGFTAGFAERLDRLSPLPVAEARDGERVQAGTVRVAPAGRHLRVVRTVDGLHLALGDEPPVWGVRPAADPLLESVVAVCGAATTAVVLTGMGRDGADGARLVRGVGGRVLVQAPATAVIDGMPRAALAAAGADVVADVATLAGAVAAVVREAARVPEAA